MRTEICQYSEGDSTFIGKLAWDDTLPGPLPAVLIAPAFGGRSPFEEERAEDLAKLGYAALAIDYYGDGRRAGSEEEAYTWMGELNADRALLARRMVSALNALKALPMVDPDRIGAMGYCFGGKCVLDLARTGERFEAAITLHGVYDAPAIAASPILPSVLILHGWDDPLATPPELLALTQELSERCKDWQLMAFGHTGHSFTNPRVNQPDHGMMFSEQATKRSWKALTDFLEERVKQKLG